MRAWRSTFQSAPATRHSGTTYDSPLCKRGRPADLENDRHHGAAEKERTLLPARFSKRISAGRSLWDPSVPGNCRRRFKLPGRRSAMFGWLPTGTLPPANSGDRLLRGEFRDSGRRKRCGQRAPEGDGRRKRGRPIDWAVLRRYRNRRSSCDEQSNIADSKFTLICCPHRRTCSTSGFVSKDPSSLLA